MKTNQLQSELVRTARLTGIWYLGLAVTGVLGFLLLHSQIYISNEPTKTLTNLIEQELLARTRLLFEFGIVTTQALAAVYFYKLFRKIDGWGAWTLGIWGMVNAVVIMISAIAMATTIELANSAELSFDNKIMLIQLLEQISSNAWGVGSLFFGLWLIPMGYIVVSSKRMPLWLGRILIIGGVGYILSPFVNYIGINNFIVDVITIPATIGEFWMIGYLLLYGIRPQNESLEATTEN